MKFVCDQCGKKYATAGDPAPGKVYKLKCKACGHLIVVRGQAGTMTGLPAISAADAAAASPVLDLQVEAAPRGAGPVPTPVPTPVTGVPRPAPEPGPIPADAGGPLPPEVALAADTAAGAPPPVPFDLPEALPELMDPALTPPPPEKDELADFAAAAAEVMASPATGDEARGQGYVELFGETGERKLEANPFAAAARASLPDTWTGAAPPATPPAPRPATPAPALAKPKPQKSSLGGAPVVIIGLGLLVLAGITAYALLGRGGSVPPAPIAAAPRTEPALPPPRPPEPVALAAPDPGVAEPQPEPAPEPKPRPPERKPERRPEPRVAERKAAPVPAPPPQAPPPAPEPRTETRDVELPDAAVALTQDVVNRVVGANRKAFGTCIAAAAGSAVKLDGRRVALRITVNTNGTVTYPTLDDQELNTTEMGQCLKSAARLMIFPKFKGDPFHYEVPLILAGT